MHRRLEHLVAALARFLRHVHRDVGVAQQLLGAFGSAFGPEVGEARCRSTRGRTPPCSRAGTAPSSAVRMRAATSAASMPSVASSSRIANSSPPSRAPVSAARRQSLQPLADLAEHEVAGRVAERVVDRLEVVEVHEQHRHRAAVARLALERVFDAVLEQRAVREPGDRVVERLVRELLLERLALARRRGCSARCRGRSRRAAGSCARPRRAARSRRWWRMRNSVQRRMVVVLARAGR